MGIYLDACATTPARHSVLQKILEVEKNSWGNPSSLHTHGINAVEILEKSRFKIAKCLGVDISEIIFTSGATESNHLCLLGATASLTPGRVVISSVEHPSVTSAAKQLEHKGWEIVQWPVDIYGMIKLEFVDELLSPPTKLVSVVWGQSEIGTIQPVKFLAESCKRRNILFHTDATQMLLQGVVNCSEVSFDFLSLSAHKVLGPKGVGILIARDPKRHLIPIQGGGQQENGYRSGTPPVSLIAGTEVAISEIYDKNKISFAQNHPDIIKVKQLTEELKVELEKNKCIEFIGHPDKRLNNHLSFLVSTKTARPLSGRDVVKALSNHGVFASSGSACSSTHMPTSSTLFAMSIDEKWVNSSVRFSLGPWLTEQDINDVPKLLDQAIFSLSRVN